MNGGDELILKLFPASPINPADINLIQGTYGIKPSLPANAGLEGVGEVVEVGNGVQKLKTGDWVLLPGDAWGTWRQFGTAPEKGYPSRFQIYFHNISYTRFSHFFGPIIMENVSLGNPKCARQPQHVATCWKAENRETEKTGDRNVMSVPQVAESVK